MASLFVAARAADAIRRAWRRRSPARWRSGTASTASAAGGLEGYLRDRELLLVLDNFEHLLPAAPAIAELLEQAPRARVLVSSRTPLRFAASRCSRSSRSSCRSDDSDATIAAQRRRCSCSSSPRSPPTAACGSTASCRAGSPRSAARSTGCRSRSSWPPRDSRLLDPAGSPISSRGRCRRRPRAARPPRPPADARRDDALELRPAQPRSAGAAARAAGCSSAASSRTRSTRWRAGRSTTSSRSCVGASLVRGPADDGPVRAARAGPRVRARASSAGARSASCAIDICATSPPRSRRRARRSTPARPRRRSRRRGSPTTPTCARALDHAIGPATSRRRSRSRSGCARSGTREC